MRPRIKTDYAEQVLIATINRPQDRNSIDTALMQELDDLLTRAEDQALRAVIFTGAKDTYFIGGADGVEMMTCNKAGAMAFSKRIQALFNRFEQSPLILVSAINGLCFGGGFEFAMACDFRIMSHHARIGLPEVKVGIIPGGGGTQRLPALVGTGKAMEMILTGRLYKAEEALLMGLVHGISPRECLIKEAQTLLEPVFKNPPHAVSQAKRAVKAFQYHSLDPGLSIERQAFGACFENNFFVDLMNEQLKTGVLQTTTPVKNKKPCGG